MNKFNQKMQDQSIIIGDGAMGTRLQARGLKSGEVSEVWNLEYPEKVAAVHREYIEAGADLIETNSFGGNYIRLKEQNLQDKFKEINCTAVEIAKSAAPKETIIAGSVGPTGKMLKPLGELAPEEAYKGYKKQIEILVNNGVDLLIIETMTDLKEMEQALKAADEFDTPAVAQMNFTSAGKTVMGDGIEEAAEIIEKYNADVAGINCTPGMSETVPLISKLNEATDLPLSTFPNAGSPRLEGGNISYPEGPEDYVAGLEELVNNNVRIIGGCCGSDPLIIAAISDYFR
ncbi:MAG: homocysteine S-methyltransferase family protein [Halanaerobiales bacterium]